VRTRSNDALSSLQPSKPPDASTDYCREARSAQRDHMRQEKTGDLPSPLPEITRQTGFTKGTLGLWSSDHFVIYYREGRVPQPGIIILGQVSGDVSVFDRPGPVKVRVERAK
jgi:Cyclophilin-like family